MAITIGSARHDEHGACYTGGTAGDQLQTSNTWDTAGEVSLQDMYTHSKGWIILRPKTAALAAAIAERMLTACNNKHVGYDQGNRYGVNTYGIDTTVDTECDCSSLVRQCVKEASGIDPGDFNTEGEVNALMATGLFENEGAYSSQSKTPVYDGDVLVTKTKGHTVVVISGSERPDAAATETQAEGWVESSAGWWYRNADGTWPANCWKVIAESKRPEIGHWYYFNADGYMLAGWQYIDGEWYYLEGNNDEGLEGACWHEKADGTGAMERWDIPMG